MRHLPELTIDFSGVPPKKNKKGQEIPVPHALIILKDNWYRVKDDRPWFHVRYHSAFPVYEDAAGQYFHTLHYFIVHPSDEVPGEPTYLLPHETDDRNRLPKVFAAGLEVSTEAASPQYYDVPREVSYLLRKINKRRKPSSITRRDFLTRKPLGIDDILDQDEPPPELHELAFREILVRETTVERNLRTWYAKKERDRLKAAEAGQAEAPDRGERSEPAEVRRAEAH